MRPRKWVPREARRRGGRNSSEAGGAVDRGRGGGGVLALPGSIRAGVEGSGCSGERAQRLQIAALAAACTPARRPTRVGN
jgi:hypothetical protein